MSNRPGKLPRTWKTSMAEPPHLGCLTIQIMLLTNLGPKWMPKMDSEHHFAPDCTSRMSGSYFLRDFSNIYPRGSYKISDFSNFDLNILNFGIT